MNTETEALLARKTWRTAEPIHGMIYFVPEAAEAYAEVGIHGRDGYFASRAAPMGAVSADVVIATFFNFNPALVHHAIPKAWDSASPGEIIAARLRAVDGAMRRLLGEDVLASQQMARAADLARTLADHASAHTEGRPLAAGHAELAWPEEAHLVLWHAQSILREYRGDGHIALLVTHGLSGLDALVTHAASGEAPADTLRGTRDWSREDWDNAVRSMVERGWLEPPGGAEDVLTFTPLGVSQRQEIEDGTDLLASAPYAALGEEQSAELRTLTRPWSKTLSDVLFR